MKLETEVRSKNTPAITDYHHSVDAGKDNEMKIFQIITLSNF